MNSSDGASASNEQGVLANLPRTRPQRASARRSAARNGSPTAATRTRARSDSKRESKRERRAATPRAAAGSRRAVRPQQTAPTQGFECDGETGSGSVHPPGAVELLASAAEVVGELAKASVSRTERLLKDVISRFPLS
jgi:hypothetical protein